MLENKKNRLTIKLGVTIALVLFLFFFIRDGQADAKTQTAVIQGKISIHPVRALKEAPEKIQPGTAVRLSLLVENEGDFTTPAGDVYIRYAFNKPLDDQPNSIIFQTEKLPVDALEPGQKTAINFTLAHEIPSFFDFVRYDWSMREYQAIFVLDHAEKMIGRAALTFSAYYYPGMVEAIPVKVPVESFSLSE